MGKNKCLVSDTNEEVSSVTTRPLALDGRDERQTSGAAQVAHLQALMVFSWELVGGIAYAALAIVHGSS
ncbi:MAG TPA: hypothetical protein VLR92_09715 [Blastocatellia bacterium]|nr:hypothetical protein [Blastocatellia bacterium]